MLETASTTIPLISPVIAAFVANADVIGGAALVTASAAALIGWAACAVRRRRPVASTPVETPQPAPLATIDFTVGDDTYTLATDHPVQPDDLRAVFVCLVRTHGPIAGHNGVVSLIEAVAANEARDLDTDLEQLDGWAR